MYTEFSNNPILVLWNWIEVGLVIRILKILDKCIPCMAPNFQEITTKKSRFWSFSSTNIVCRSKKSGLENINLCQDNTCKYWFSTLEIFKIYKRNALYLILMPVLLHNVVSNFLETDAVCITMFFCCSSYFCKAAIWQPAAAWHWHNG